MNQSEIEKELHNFDLSTFAKAQKDMIATNNNSYGIRRTYGSNSQFLKYTEEDIKNIIENGSLNEQQTLSRNFFNKDGYYKQLILHYATLLKYVGILIPNPSQGKSLSTSHIQKKYYAALDFVERMNIPEFCTNCAQKALINGCYYGLINKNSKTTFSIIDLPLAYCTTQFKDYEGNDIIQFDVSYFDSIFDADKKKAALAAYPDFVIRSYQKWKKKGNSERWIFIPSELGICFPIFDGRPFFLNVIPATIQYEDAVETEREREKEEIRKILVQKIPHLNDGRLLFEPDEAVEIHKGAVGMVRSNKNTSVLTTYTDVDAILSNTTAENNNTALEKMQQNIYSQAGVSGEIFAASGGNTTETSLKFDTAVMMSLANKFAKFITSLVNRNYSNTNINFKYTILPVTYHNAEKYIDSSTKLATSGYSLLIPALAQGLSQRDLINIKDLENDTLKLVDKLIPPKTSFTQSGEESDNNGRPKKEEGEKKDQTLKNEQSIEKSKVQGGSE